MLIVHSLCPLNSSNPIAAEAIIPVGASDVSGIPAIALQIPDFEGYATLRFFSNSTKTQIGCFRARMRNGATFNQSSAVAPVLGVFTLVALLASFFTAIYGINLPVTRTHHAHSLSVLVVFEVFQSIFFSGALSLNWPSVLAAWWSNFAWSAGMIYSSQIEGSINKFTGNTGNSSQAGGAGSTPINNNGGLLQQLYGRSLPTMARDLYHSVLRGNDVADRVYKRESGNNGTGTNSGYSWNGGPVAPGLVSPGNWSNFAGELSEVGIPASNAFITGFIWFLVLIAGLLAVTVSFKGILELLGSWRRIKPDRLSLFRTHWVGFLGLIVLRTLFIGFFMIMTLTLFQFTLMGPAGVTAIAAIVFAIFFVGILGIAGYACFYRLRFGHYESSPDRLHFRSRKGSPWFRAVRQSSLGDEAASQKSGGSMPFFRVRYIDNNAERASVHQDEDYIKRFGWLSARFRRTRWWFFAIWAGYQFIRACFIGGGNGHPEVQVFGILVVEILALIATVWIDPFEGARNTALAVYMLGISKVATAGLSIAFLPRLNLDRILATVIGVVIIVIQGFLVIGLLILIVLGAISTWFSLTRNREEFKPHSWEGLRVKYFNHIDTKSKDLPPPPPAVPEEPKEPYFNVQSVRRAPKIEDEDDDILPGMEDPAASQFSLGARASRAASIASHYSGYGNAPYGARVHRMSWSSRDFVNWQQQEGLTESPSRAPSRGVSAAYGGLPDNSYSMQPLVRPQPSMGSLRSGTPNRTTQGYYAGQRFSGAMPRDVQ
jgi:hypothetical protein